MSWKLELSPITKSLLGSVQLKDEELDYKQLIEDEIIKKHL